MSFSTGLRWIVVFVCLFAATDSIAQSDFSRHNWYFGNTTRAIRYSRSDNTPALINNKAIPFSTGGSAVATNPINGDLLFYTDGQNVYDATFPVRGVIMQNGNLGALAGSPRNQPVAVSRVPNSLTQYYIFRNDASFTTPGNIQVSTVDMSLSGNEIFPEPVSGAVMNPKNVAIAGLGGRSEAMIVVPHADGTNFWLITHANGQDDYTATLIDGTGSFTPVLSIDIGLPISAANFSYHAATGKIAVSPQSANSNVAILNFDNATGIITFDRFVLTSGVSSTIDQAVYDTEWSPTGRFLYISIHGDPVAPVTADVVQFDMTAPASNSLVSVLPPPPAAIARSYGLKLAPDTAIYHLYQATAGGPFLLERLTQVDSIAPLVIRTADAFGGAINFNGRQFPEFLPQADNNMILSFRTTGNCENYPVSFFPTVIPAADSLNWSFGDGDTSSDWSPVHTYENGGTVTVRLTAFLNGQSEFVEQPVTITNFDLQLTLPSDTTACRCEFPPPVGDSCNGGPFRVEVQSSNGSGTVNFQWSNGDTGNTLTPDSAGYYYVLATDGTPGCVAYAGVNVREYDAEDQRANVWYFGLNAGIDFNEQPAIPIPITTDPDGSVTPPIQSPEGVSVISDRNGFVIFSTDGVHVFDRQDRIIEESPGVPLELGGENGSAQSALIVPVPDDETLYYIFTTQQVHGSNTYELRYALYDIKLNDGVNFNNGDGGIVMHNQILFTRSTERITSDGRWLIAHEFGNNAFRAYEITADGIGNPVISSIGSDHRLSENGSQGLMGQGYMKLSGDRLAVALPDPPDNFIELFTFVDSTGVVTNFRRLDLEADEGQVYGIEFAGNKILATIYGTTQSFLREAYINFQGNPVLVPGSEDTDPISAELGAIQLAPNGSIYVAINGSNFLGQIIVAGDTLQLSTLNETGFSLAAGAQSTLGLPNFIQEIFEGNGGPSMSVIGTCVGSPSQFQVNGTDAIDEFLWTYDGGFTSTESTFSYTFGTPGSKVVTVRITNRCGLDTLLTQTVVISPSPPTPTFLAPGQQPVVCNGPITLQALPANDPTLSYLWSTGETTFSISVSQPRNIGLTITNPQGCTSNRNITVVDNRPVLDLGPDQEVCQDVPIAPLDAENPGLDYVWEINDVDLGNRSRTQSVSTATPGSFKYWVEVSDDITTCRVRDSVVFNVNAAPVFTATAAPIVCTANNGEIELTISAPASGTFSYNVTGLNTGASQSGTNQPTAPPSIFVSGLAVDTYIVDVTEQLSGCETSTSVGVNSTLISIANLNAQTPRCDEVALTFDITAAPNGSTYRVLDANTGAVIHGPQAVGTVPAIGIVTGLVPVPGEYTIEVLEPSGCTASETINVVSDPVIDASIDYDVCPDLTFTATLPSVPAGITYEWFGPTTIDNVNSQTTTAVAPATPGTYTYGVILRAPGFCETTHTVEIIIDDVDVDFTIPADQCVDNLTITATVDPPGDYTFIWYRDGNPITPSGQSLLVTTAESGSDFQVEAISTASGCSFTSQPKTVNVFGVVNVFMQPVAPCRGEVFSIQANVIPVTPAATYQWFFEGTLIAGQNSSTLTGRTLEGEYRVVATRNGCSDDITQEIEFVDDPDGGLPNRRFICNDPQNIACSQPPPLNSSCEFNLVAAFGVSWQWYRANEVGGPRSPLPGETNKTLHVTDRGVYSVDIIGPTGCTTTDMTEVIERCDPQINLPNVFRPEGDQEVNQTFRVEPYQVFVSPDKFQIFIYNRWGEMVFQSNRLDFAWNGTYNGTGSQLLPGGTYTYVIKYFGSTSSAGQQELRGAVMLLR